MNDRDHRALLLFAHELLDETDAILLGHFGGRVAATAKPDATLVTAADSDIEELLRARIGDRFPGHGFLGEELGEWRGDGDARWIIDPIDGTHNFVRGIPIVGTLLALERGANLVLGVVSAPVLGQRWSAVAGGGATVRGQGAERSIHVSSVDRLEDAQICYGSMGGVEGAGALPGLQRLIRTSWRDRGFGDFWAHMLVAQGSAEVMVDCGVKPWDLAAPYLVVSEAGGRMTDLDGVPSWAGPYAITTNASFHDKVLEMLRRV